MRLITLSSSLLLLLSACTPTPHDVKVAEEPLELYPDYQGVTVPCNMAPLNCLVRNEGTEALQLQVEDVTIQTRGNKIQWDMPIWKSLISSHLGDTLTLNLTACIEGQWQSFAPFQWIISPDSIDAYVTYRLIEPGYEVWHEVDIEERCIEDFSTRTIANGKRLGNRCMNCHTHGGDQGQYSFFYIRGEKGGTILQRNGRLRKLTLSSPRSNGGSVYGDWHPSGRYGLFSTNKIIPAFHSNPSRRLEVYDTRSDLMIVDFDQDSILADPIISQTAEILETFPCFSADGTQIFYCGAMAPIPSQEAKAVEMQNMIDSLHYSLYQVSFDAKTGTIGTPQIVYTHEGSVSFPKCSPDGQYLAYTTSDYGTFPIWHREARLVVGALGQECTDDNTTLTPLCQTDIHATYHTWSHNSQWLAFASKEYDSQYGRIHFVHINHDKDGKVSLSKPITLPQADPSHDDMNLRSYNIPDLSKVKMPYDHDKISLIFEQNQATLMH